MLAAAGTYATRAGVAFQAFQIRAHLRCALVAQVAVFFHPFVNQLCELNRKRGIQAERVMRVPVHDLIEICAGAFAFERQRACRHLVNHERERKQVGARVQFFSQNLLGGHVQDRAQRRARAGQPMRFHRHGCGSFCSGAGRVHCGDFRKAEVQHLSVTARGDKNICGLDVAMNDATRVGNIERIGDLDREFQQEIGLQRTAGDTVLERRTFEELHHYEGVLTLLRDLVNSPNVRMVQRGSCASFPPKTFKGLWVVGDVVREEFQAENGRALGLPLCTDAHSTAAEFFEDAIVRNGATQQGRGVIHCAHVTSEGTLRAIVCRLKGILRSENVTQLFHVNAVAGGASVQFLKLGFRRGDTRVVRAVSRIQPKQSVSARRPRTPRRSIPESRALGESSLHNHFEHA